MLSPSSMFVLNIVSAKQSHQYGVCVLGVRVEEGEDDAHPCFDLPAYSGTQLAKSRFRSSAVARPCGRVR